MPEISKTSQIKYKMDKSDYEKMRNLFGTINWETELRKSVEQTWTYFHDVYTQVTNECIPKCQVRPPRWRRLLWMSTAAVKLKKKNTGHGKDTKAPAVMKIMRSMLEREMLHKI